MPIRVLKTVRIDEGASEDLGARESRESRGPRGWHAIWNDISVSLDRRRISIARIQTRLQLAPRGLADGNVARAAASADVDRDVGNTSRYPEIDVAGRTPCTCDAIDVHPPARARAPAPAPARLTYRRSRNGRSLSANREACAERCASLFARAPVVHQSPRQPLRPPSALFASRPSARSPPVPAPRPENVSWYTNSRQRASASTRSDQ